MTTSTTVTHETLVGRVKWFNSNSGFGFITLTDDSSGTHNGSDIFVHHSSIKVSNEQYRYLVQGEYVEFSLSPTTQGPHQFQALNVCGIKGGKLMCETRRDVKVERNNYYDSKKTDSSSPNEEKPVSRKRATHKVQPNSNPKVRGEGPREGGEWTYVVKSGGRQNADEAKSQPRREPARHKKNVVRSDKN
jgi:CspA family cold shock protein